MSYWVYILQCCDQSLYTGLTTDLTRRLAEHQAGLPHGARYTHARRPVSLVWQSDPLPDRKQASALEWRIKKLSRHEKQRLIQQSLT